ncbi:MAG: alanyl-tRNA editing protein [Candidatus Methanogranum gryphiswaldense]|nr:MAG: alanyl-tRNA editing protein [Candidatus Methanogranum sp. U3.2.1]
MTEEIFKRDGYVFEFESKVISKKGDLIELESTAFYPGGGGQICDTGTIRGEKVTEVIYENNRILHRVKNNNLNPGDTVWCSVDWERRYDLMQGHTGEHLLFCSLKRQDPELEITKIYISSESKYVIVNHDISWDKIKEAVKFANQAIRDNLPVTKTLMNRDDPDISTVRVKLERIEEEEISVVAIGNIDLSACSGIHVMETSELEFLFVDRKVSAGKDGVAIHFKIGNAAKDAAIELANICLQATEEAESKPELLVRTISNIKQEIETGREMLKNASKQQLAHLKPESLNGVDIYSGKFSADKKILTDAAENYKSKGNIAAFVSVSDSVSIILASGNQNIDCKKILSEILTEFGGRGGGKSDFAQGGIEDISKADAILEKMIKTIKSSL